MQPLVFGLNSMLLNTSEDAGTFVQFEGVLELLKRALKECTDGNIEVCAGSGRTRVDQLFMQMQMEYPKIETRILILLKYDETVTKVIIFSDLLRFR